MSEHQARIHWTRGEHDFTYERYRRDHTWHFPGGETVAASSAPEYLGSVERVDSEEAFVAAVASCHMLTFLAIAARKRIVIESYEDAAVGTMEKNEEGRLAVTRIVLRPRIDFGGEPPDASALARLHEQAHEHCFIANSIRTQVVVE